MKLLGRLTKARLERYRARAPLTLLARESGIPVGPLCEYERGIRKLTPEERRRRARALARIAEMPEA